jgi:hypothetical protein
MSVENEVQKLFVPDRPLDPSKLLTDAQKLLEKDCQPGGELDPRIPSNETRACEAFGNTANRFFGKNLFAAGKSLLEGAWRKFAQIQSEEGKHIYRAGIAMYLAMAYYYLQDDKGAAFWWALHTHADDQLGQHEGSGKQLLHTGLGMSDAAFSTLHEIANENAKKASSEGWSSIYGFAEHVVVRFVLAKPDFAPLFSRKTDVDEFPICPAYFQSLVRRTDRGTKQSRGSALEDLGSYLFLLLPGWVPQRNLLHAEKTFELDLVVRFFASASTMSTDLATRHLEKGGLKARGEPGKVRVVKRNQPGDDECAISPHQHCTAVCMNA